MADRGTVERLSRVRQFVFGSLDGILVPLAVISGVAGGTSNPRAVIVAGLAEAFGGALSMAFGELISSRSEAQVRQSLVDAELRHVDEDLKLEEGEVADLFVREGVEPSDAAAIATQLAKYPRSFKILVVEKELGLEVDIPTVHPTEAGVMGASYVLGSIFPLAAYFFLPIPLALPVSFLLTLLALVTVGVVKGRLASLSVLGSIVEVVAVGALSALGGYFVGVYIPKLLGM